jgi:hypothetical protein
MDIPQLTLEEDLALQDMNLIDKPTSGTTSATREISLSLCLERFTFFRDNQLQVATTTRRTLHDLANKHPQH